MSLPIPDLPSTILIVIEDSKDDFDLVMGRLRSAGWSARAVRVETAEELHQALHLGPCSAVISDHRLPRFSSLEALRMVREFDPDLPFLIVSGAIGEEVAVEAMQAGADDYIMKDKLGRLVPSLQRALDAAAARRRQREAEAALGESEARFRALTANLPGMVFQMQVIENDLWLVYVSEGSRRLFGLAPKQLINEPALLFGLLSPADAAALRSALWQAATEKSYAEWVGRVVAREGVSTTWIAVEARARTSSRGRVLWDGIVTDISAQKQAEYELRTSQHELRELASHLARVREQDRESIAREIHDDVGSTLMAAKFDVAWLIGQLRAQSKGELKSEPAWLAKLQQIDQLVDSVILSSTRIMLDLRPAIIDEGIVAALEWQARSFETRMDLPCVFNSSSEDIELNRDQAIAIFRIVQEALNNIAKYAQASLVEIDLETHGATLDLEVRDNGKGMTPGDRVKSECFGLRGMKERAHSLGGTLHVASSPGEGTTIALSLPLPVPLSPNGCLSQA